MRAWPMILTRSEDKLYDDNNGKIVRKNKMRLLQASSQKINGYCTYIGRLRRMSTILSVLNVSLYRFRFRQNMT